MDTDDGLCVSGIDVRRRARVLILGAAASEVQSWESGWAWGPGRDRSWSSRRLDELEKCLSIPERVTLGGTTHARPLENPAAFNGAVLGFLGKQ